MLKTRIPLCWALVGLLMTAACTDYAPMAPPDAAENAPPLDGTVRALTSGQRGLDAEFTRLAAELPGFGGMFYDETGALNVYITHDHRAQTIRNGQVSARVQGWLRSRDIGGFGATAAATRDVVIREGAYEFSRLAAWHEQLSPEVLRLPDVVFTDIAEADNRLRVGVTKSAAAVRVQRRITALGIPRDAVIIDMTSPIRQAATLRDFVRPTAGGQQVFFPVPPAAFVCTLGFNARQFERDHFAIPSHCTAVQGGVEGTQYFQPAPPERFLGTEVVDPPYRAFEGLCPPTRRCRLSDAALARYADRVEIGFGQIMRTTFADAFFGSLELTDRRFRIVSEVPFPLGGELLNKVGRSTGWTAGPVIFTCVNLNVGGTNITLFCQDVVLAGVEGGDSGAPVFQVLGGLNLVALYGMLWGSGAVLTPQGPLPVFLFSAMENIELELGGLRTF